MPALVLLDTNPILRHVLDDHADHSPRAHALFERIEQGVERVRLTDTVVFEAVFTLERLYHIPRGEIGATIADLLQLPGIVLPGKRFYRQVFELWIQQQRLSFADCYHAVLVGRLGLAGILSFDRGFDRVTGLMRREP